MRVTLPSIARFLTDGLRMPDEMVTPFADPDIQSPEPDRLQLVARATQDLIWDWDLLGHHVVWAGNTEPFFGCGPDEVGLASGSEHLAWAELVHPEDLAATEAASAMALNG